MTAKERNAGDELLGHLVLMLGTSALQQLGKLVHPATGKAEVNLEAARFSIDLLEMLERKTRGNLTGEEKRFLDQQLTNLRLNYVEVSEAAGKAPASTEPTEPKSETAAPTDAPPSEAGEVKAESPKPGEPPRFHKSYG